MKSLETIKRENTLRLLNLGEPLPAASRGTIKTDSVTLRVLEPFNRVQLMVFTRNADGPFSCRIIGPKRRYELTTVLGLVMPDRNDLLAEPTLRLINPNTYADLVDLAPLKDSIRKFILELEYCIAHGSFDQLTHLSNMLTTLKDSL